MVAIAGAVVVVAITLPSLVLAQGNPLGLNAEEIRLILRHGPWPAPWTRDASNRVSGKAEAIAFGELLSFEPRLSAAGAVSLRDLPHTR